MSDIELQIDVGELLWIALLIGWPGLIAGAGIGAWTWRGPRVFGAAIGGVLGLSILAGLRLSSVWPFA